jgi:hypothetical protein
MAIIRMTQLCHTGETLYALDTEGRVWYIRTDNGQWDLHENPTERTLLDRTEVGFKDHRHP